MSDEDERKVFEYIMQRMLCKACNRITMIIFAFLCERAKAIQIRVCVDTHRFQKRRKKPPVSFKNIWTSVDRALKVYSIRDLSEISRGEGGGNFKFGFGN